MFTIYLKHTDCNVNGFNSILFLKKISIFEKGFYIYFLQVLNLEEKKIVLTCIFRYHQ